MHICGDEPYFLLFSRSIFLALQGSTIHISDNVFLDILQKGTFRALKSEEIFAVEPFCYFSNTMNL